MREPFLSVRKGCLSETSPLRRLREAIWGWGGVCLRLRRAVLGGEIGSLRGREGAPASS